MTNVLAQKAVLAHLNISTWGARRFDRNVTEEINSSKGAASDAGRYNKLLIEKSDLEPITKAVSAARHTFATMTLPWLNDGVRILPAASYMDFTAKMRTCRIEFDSVVTVFEHAYPGMIQAARKRLNGMFNADDYPRPSEIREAFSFETRFMDVPTGDFRVELAQSDIENMRADVEADLEKALNGAMVDVRDRIVDVVQRMAERLRAYDDKEEGCRTGSFRDTLVGNIRDLAAMLPAMNMTNDPALATIIARITKDLCEHDAQELRDDDRVRKQVTRKAERILSDVKSFMA